MSKKRIIRGNSRQTRAYISLGSNEGDRVGFVQQAMQLLKDISQIKVIECSSLYETQSIAENDPTWFVNAVAAIETNLSAQELLDVCKDIQSRLNQLHGSSEFSSNPDRQRIIDLDILFFDNQIIDQPDLQIPHPQIAKKAYSLVPLLEIAPELTYPGTNKSVAQLHEELPQPELVYLYGTREIDNSSR